jgi:hypothetical protein
MVPVVWSAQRAGTPVSPWPAERSTVAVLARRLRIRLPARNPPTRNAREARS